MDSLGLFTVAYVRDTNNNNPDVFAKVYNAFGDLLNVVSVATTGRAETEPSIAMTPDGRFDVAWEDASSSNNHDIKMNSYSWNGGLLATYAISSSASTDFLPSVAVDDNFDAVVAWSRAGNGGSDVEARSGSNQFGVMGPEIDIASSPALETAGSVAIKHSGGRTSSWPTTAPSPPRSRSRSRKCRPLARSRCSTPASSGLTGR